MKVLLVCFDLSNNALGRVHVLAGLLAAHHEVEVLGPSRRGIWAPLREDRVATFRIVSKPALVSAIARSDADVVIACKPKLTSFGAALVATRRSGTPLVLDIDDWEPGFFTTWQDKVRTSLELWNTDSYLYARLMERLVPVCADRVVSNSFLQRRFGGALIPHVRDMDQFDPARFDREAEKERLGVAGLQVVLFLGSPRRHKGLDGLIAAVERLRRPGVVLLIVGASGRDEVAFAGSETLRIFGQQPFSEIARFLVAADVVAIPQRGSSATRGQLPAKLFDAMAMGRAVVATAVSDIPEIVGDAGVIVPPDDVGALSAAIGELLDDPARRALLGERARHRCSTSYSTEAMSRVLEGVIDTAVARAARPGALP